MYRGHRSTEDPAPPSESTTLHDEHLASLGHPTQAYTTHLHRHISISIPHLKPVDDSGWHQYLMKI